MKKLTDKQKRIIAYIIAVWFAIFGSIGMVQTGLNIANCAGKNKETKKAYALEEGTTNTITFSAPLGNIYTNNPNLSQYQATNRIWFQFNAQEIKVWYTADIGQNVNKITGWTENNGNITAQIEKYYVTTFNTERPTVAYFDGYTAYMPGQNITIINKGGTIRVKPTYIPTNAQITIYETQIVFQFGKSDTTEQSEYILYMINTSEYSKFIPQLPYYMNGSINDSYTKGYNVGYNEGEKNKELYGETKYNAGVQAGIASANKYTFKSLISAVFDVPIQTIWGMLNFNILGVNILTLITSIISLIIIIAILKQIT